MIGEVKLNAGHIVRWKEEKKSSDIINKTKQFCPPDKFDKLKETVIYNIENRFNTK